MSVVSEKIVVKMSWLNVVFSTFGYVMVHDDELVFFCIKVSTASKGICWVHLEMIA
jgi:hypothetical protein